MQSTRVNFPQSINSLSFFPLSMWWILTFLFIRRPHWVGRILCTPVEEAQVKWFIFRASYWIWVNHPGKVSSYYFLSKPSLFGGNGILLITSSCCWFQICEPDPPDCGRCLECDVFAGHLTTCSQFKFFLNIAQRARVSASPTVNSTPSGT